MHCIKTFLWQPYETLLPEEGDDASMLEDKLKTLQGCRNDCRTSSSGYYLLSPGCIFGAIVIISALGLSGILPGATTAWMLAGLGGAVIAANILIGNIKNRLACASNYAIVGFIIMGVGLAGAFGAIPAMTVGTAVLITWLVGNCFGYYFGTFNSYAQQVFNPIVAHKLTLALSAQAQTPIVE